MNIQLIQFAEAKQPQYTEKKGEGYIMYGDRNDYPQYLIELFNKSAKHNAIVKSKVHYICGNGWTGSSEQFIKHINRTETLDDITTKISLDIELFGGSFMEVIWGIDKKVSEVWHCDYSKFRTNKDNSQFWYKDDWNDRKEKAEVYLGFNPNFPEGKQILYVKEYRPNVGSYALPSYFGALNYIESDIEVSKHVLGNAKTGFSASKLITLPNGEPSPEEQRVVHNKFKNTYTGADGIKYMLAFVNDASRKPIVDDLGTSDLTKEDFARVDSLIQVNIFSGHQITTPSIFGIAEAGKLGSRTEMRDGYEIFKNSYVNAKQMFLESTFNMLAGFAGYVEDLKIIPTEPVGIELSETGLLQIMSKDELRERIGLPIIDVQSTSTNQDVIDAINSLSPLVANKVLNQLTPNELRALVSLQPTQGGEAIPTASQSSEFSDVQNIVQQYKDVDSLKIFSEFGEDKGGFNVWKQKNVFQDVELFADVTQLQSSILDLISKDKRITPEVIADTLKESVSTVNNIIKDLEDKGFLKSKDSKIGKGIEENVIIERTLTQPLSDIVEQVRPKTTAFLIRYSYEWIAGFSDANLTTSRDFCKYVLQANKMYSRSEIETISARLGYSVWDRRGGWWTKPNGVHSESCRHEWKSNIVTRK
jgi:DNA-binding Lrp family transcriptional regulator